MYCFIIAYYAAEVKVSKIIKIIVSYRRDDSVRRAYASHVGDLGFNNLGCLNKVWQLYCQTLGLTRGTVDVARYNLSLIDGHDLSQTNNHDCISDIKHSPFVPC